MRDLRSDTGSVIVEQLMTMILVVVLALGVLQVALAVHVRNTLIESAAEGARLAARVDRDLADGAARAESLAHESLGGLEVSAAAADATIAGMPAVEVTLTAPVPVLGLWGPAESTVRGTALQEPSSG